MSEMRRLFHTNTPMLLIALKEGPMSAIELSKVTDKDQSYIQKNMKMNRERGLVRRLDDKRWELTGYGEDVVDALLECEGKLALTRESYKV